MGGEGVMFSKLDGDFTGHTAVDAAADINAGQLFKFAFWLFFQRLAFGLDVGTFRVGL